jgi:hypothetical protein
MNYLLVTHSLRIRHFLNSYFTKDLSEIFGNGCVFRMTLARKSTSIQMLFPGYEVNGELASVKFSTASISTRKLIGNIYLYRNINIYIVRHGISKHNTVLYKNPQFPLFMNDPRLVPKAKLLLEKSIPYLPKKFDLVFASSLVRTRETLAILLMDYPNRTIYIVPGASEIESKDNQLEVPISQYRNVPKTFTIDWNTIPNGKNMIDEIVKGQHILKIENKIKNQKKLKKK